MTCKLKINWEGKEGGRKYRQKLKKERKGRSKGGWEGRGRGGRKERKREGGVCLVGCGVISALRRKRKEDYRFKASLGYVVSSVSNKRVREGNGKG
jgi:hypothetical protein